MNNPDKIINTLLNHFPELQAVYIFGSWGSSEEQPHSDIDMAILLSPIVSGQTDLKSLHQAKFDLESVLDKDVDLINLRRVNTILQKEVVISGKRIYCSDEFSCEQFEMLVFSAYQKLNQERADIVAEIIKSSRVLAL